MFLGFLVLITGLTISGVAIYYSVIGMAAIFAAMPIPVYIMGTTLEIAKLVGASWLKANWNRAPGFIKSYMIIAILILMMITSMGIFGFLSKAHSDQSLVSGDVLDKIAIIEEKIKTQKDNIDANRKALIQLDQAVDQTMARSTSEKGAGRAVDIRRSQNKERSLLRTEIETAQREIAKLNEERAPISKDLRKVEAEVGPIKYIAAFIYGDNPNQNILEKAVTWVIIMIVIVFDPLAVIMLLAAQMTFQWNNDSKKKLPLIPEPISPVLPSVDTKNNRDSDKPVLSVTNESIIEKEARRYHPLGIRLPVFDFQEKNIIEPTKEIITSMPSDFKPKDFLYQEYARDQFKGLNFNNDEEPELYKFIKDSENGPKFNNYSVDILKYFARRIYELRKNNSNNPT